MKESSPYALFHDFSELTPTRKQAMELVEEALWPVFQALGDTAPHPRRTATPFPHVSEAPPRHRRNFWTRDNVLAAVRAFLAQHGRAPTRHEWRCATLYALPSLATVRRLWPHQGALVVEASRACRPSPSQRGDTPC